MEIICAGYGKTGTKTSSAALRKLGVKVADYPETALYLSEIWLKYIEDQATIEEVIGTVEIIIKKVISMTIKIIGIFNICQRSTTRMGSRRIRIFRGISHGTNYLKPRPMPRSF